MDNYNELLVTAVEKRTALYDKTEDNYSNRVFINKPWNEIGQELVLKVSGFIRMYARHFSSSIL